MAGVGVPPGGLDVPGVSLVTVEISGVVVPSLDAEVQAVTTTSAPTTSAAWRRCMTSDWHESGRGVSREDLASLNVGYSSTLIAAVGQRSTASLTFWASSGPGCSFKM